MPRLLILLFLFSNIIIGQDNTEIKYYKDKYGRTEVAKGPYMLTTKKINDSVTSLTFSKTTNGKKIWTKSFLGNQPYGIWTRYDRKGTITSTMDYHFKVKYGKFIPENAIKITDLGVTIKSDTNTKKIQKHIVKHFRYPEIAQEKNIQGKVTVQFTIDESGQVGNLRILEGVHLSLDTECYRIMRALKELDPYEKDGKKVMVYYTIPITFKMA